MDLNQDYFELFGLPARFELDIESLAARYRELQAQTHPDRFAGASDQEKRTAMQLTTYLNEAYQALKDPAKRARCLLELQGLGVDEHANRAMAPAFLMEQMELREALAAVKDSADPQSRLEGLLGDVQRRARAMLQELSDSFAAGTPEALERARTLVLEMQFIRRLEEELLALEEQLF